MNQYRTTRKSHCDVCGKRLSEKTKLGDIKWRPSHIDDKGIYCVTCYVPKGAGKEQKGGRG